MFQLAFDLARQHINLRDPIDLIPEKFHSYRRITVVRRKNLQHIPTHPERTAMKIHIISHILHVDQLTDHFIPILFHTRTQRYHHILIIYRTSKTVDAGHTGNNDHVLPLRQRCCSRKP